MKKDKSKRYLLLALAVAGIVMTYLVGKSFLSAPAEAETMPMGDSFAVLSIYGTIQGEPDSVLDEVSYNHPKLMECVDGLMEDPTNTGILLKVNSGGGTVYHSDEFYLKLMEYKEKTGRPVFAYFEDTAASGAYYISCASDYICANRNAWIGSIGVIISYYDYSALFDKLGVEEVIIASGANKAMGHPGEPLTEEQRAIYQATVDESYDTFVGIVARGRGLDLDYVKSLADGRIYTAKQCLENGLIDEVCSYEQCIQKMKDITGAEPYEVTFPSEATFFDMLFARAEALVPKNEIESMQSAFTQKMSGVPLYYYAG